MPPLFIFIFYYHITIIENISIFGYMKIFQSKLTLRNILMIRIVTLLR